MVGTVATIRMVVATIAMVSVIVVTTAATVVIPIAIAITAVSDTTVDPFKKITLVGSLGLGTLVELPTRIFSRIRR